MRQIFVSIQYWRNSLNTTRDLQPDVSYCDALPAHWCVDQPENASFLNQLAKSRLKDIEIRFVRVAYPSQSDQFFVVCFTRVPIFGNHPGSLLRKWFPRLSIQLAAVGNPTGSIEADDSVPARSTLRAVNCLLARHCNFICWKSLPIELRDKRCVTLRSLPAAILTIDHDYWGSMSAKRRKDLKRHMKAASTLRLEDKRGLPESLVDRVYQLYESTRNRSANSLVKHSRDYFLKTADISRYLLYFENDTLIGFHQLLQGKNTLCCKYVGMDYERGQQYRLYFAMMIEAVNIAIREDILLVNFGITSYEFKQHLGAQLLPTWNVFTHATMAGRYLLPHLRFLLEPNTVLPSIAVEQNHSIANFRYTGWKHYISETFCGTH